MQHFSAPPVLSLPSEGLARLPIVLNATGLSRSTLYARVKIGEFPSPVKLGERSVAWPVEQVRAWIASRIQAANNARTQLDQSRIVGAQ